VAVEVGIEVAEKEAVVVAPRARRRHPLVDAEDAQSWRPEALDRGASIAISSAFYLSPSTLEPEHVDGFEFGVTLNYGGDPDSIRLPRKFSDVVDIRTKQDVPRVHGGATGIWPTDLLFDCTGTPYLANGWRRFCQRHEIVAGHFVVFNYDGDHQITFTVFDETMCHRHYVTPTRGKDTVSSSSSEDDQ
jgi:hypothetical protein